MYEVTMQELSVFVVLGFMLGVFTSFYLTRLFEVVHMWRLLREVVAHLLLMCLGIVENVAFLQELKRKQMREADFTDEQIRKFEEVDERTLTNWKDTVILSLVTKVPRQFRSTMPFNNWYEAMAFLKTELRSLGGEKEE
jgi:putative Mn2+ efflux pump MntP